MAEITLVTVTDPRRLLEAAADGFLSPVRASSDDPFPTPPYLLALRQGGIREDLFQLAAEQGVPGWFDPPICTFQELPAWLGIPERLPLDDFERVTLLGEVLRSVDGKVFHAKKSVDRFVDAVDRLFGELTAEGVTPERLSEAFAAVPDRDHFETDRDRELVTAYRTYLDRLRDAGRRDGRDTWPACADVVRDNPDAFAERLGGRREIRLFGLSDLRGGWRILLKALAESPALDRIAIYTGPEVTLEIEWPHTRVSLDEPESVAAQLFGEPVADPAPAHEFDCLRPPDTDTEVEWVAARVRQLADDGVPLHRIAIVSRQARPYARHVLRALERAGVPATARERAALQEIPVVRAVLSVVAAAAEGWTRHALAELAGQPYLQLPLAPRVINYLGFQRRIEGLKAWDDALEKQERASVEFFAADEAGEEERHRGPRPPRPERVTRTREALALLVDRLEVPSGNQPLESWVAWLDGFLTDDPLGIKDSVYRVPAERFDLARWDLSAWRGVRRIVRQWHEVLEEWGGGEQVLSAATFHEVLRETLSGDAPVWTTVQRGVRVLEGMAAAYRHFDHLFLVGMQAGSFPVRQPRPTVLGEQEREAMRAAGLPLDRASDRDHRERELFRVLVAGAGALTVSYPSIDQAGRDVIRSVFVDELADVAVPKHVDPQSLLSLPVADSDAAYDQARHAFRVERLRETGQLSPYNGAIERQDLLERLAAEYGDEHVWSPTQLETYAKCPWGFFSTRILRLDREEDPDHDIDARTRGIVLHDVLQRFYDRARERVDGPVYLLPQDESWALPMLHDALDEALADAEGAAWLGHPTLRPATREDMRRVLETFLRAECQEHEDQHSTSLRKAPKMVRTGVTENELAFQDAVLQRKGITLRYRGVIDRVECGIDERVDTGHLLAAVDYKSSRYSAPGGGDSAAWDDGVVLQIPLYAHALKGCYEGKEVARVEYWGLKQGVPVHRLELYQVDKKTGELLKNSEAHDKMDRALDAAVDHVRKVRAGKFPAELPPSSNCSPFCHFIDICRVADGPQVSKWGGR